MVIHFQRWRYTLFLVASIFALCAITVVTYYAHHLPIAKNSGSALHTIVIEMGPYDLHHKYRAMEGPHAWARFKIQKAVDKTIVIPESQVHFMENDKAIATTKSQERPFHSIPQPIDLYWFIGARVDVIDENEHLMPDSTYFCHGQLLLTSSKLHQHFFPDSTPIRKSWLYLFSQGQNIIMLPQGFGVPMAAGEKMWINLKAINPYPGVHKRIKLRCTIFLVKDRELKQPLLPLNWQIACVRVRLPEKSVVRTACSSSCCIDTAQDAPNNAIHWRERDTDGHLLTGHWVVPPGRHTYSVALLAPKNANFALNGHIRMAWAHVHPFCETVSLIEDLNGKKRNVFTIHAITTRNPGIQLAHIDLINTPQGLPLNNNANYSLAVTYNNTSGKPQDSMTIVGIFFSDLKFRKPSWAG
jgi:hypothetical protein